MLRVFRGKAGFRVSCSSVSGGTCLMKKYLQIKTSFKSNQRLTVLSHGMKDDLMYVYINNMNTLLYTFIGDVTKHFNFGWEGLKLEKAQISKPSYRTKHFKSAIFYLRVKDLPVFFIGCFWRYRSGRDVYICHLWTGPWS